jgi:putative transposase
MLVLEFKAYGKAFQFVAVDEAIRITQFIRNKSLRLWMNCKAKSWLERSRNCTFLAKEFDLANRLNSMAKQASAERAWAAITRFYENCQKKTLKKKGFPKFQKNCRSVEYKTSGWKLTQDRKSITFTDKCGIGKLKLKGTRTLLFYSLDQVKRVRLVKRADGVYVQFSISVDRSESIPATGNAIGLDVGLKELYTDSNGETAINPRFLDTGELRLKKAQKRLSKRVKGSNNRRKARVVLGKRHLKISRQSYCTMLSS